MTRDERFHRVFTRFFIFPRFKVFYFSPLFISMIRVIFDSGQFATLRENMTSSTKPEVHSVALPSEEDQAHGR